MGTAQRISAYVRPAFFFAVSIGASSCAATTAEPVQPQQLLARCEVGMVLSDNETCRWNIPQRGRIKITSGFRLHVEGNIDGRPYNIDCDLNVSSSFSSEDRSLVECARGVLVMDIARLTPLRVRYLNDNRWRIESLLTNR